MTTFMPDPITGLYVRRCTTQLHPTSRQETQYGSDSNTNGESHATFDGASLLEKSIRSPWPKPRDPSTITVSDMVQGALSEFVRPSFSGPNVFRFAEVEERLKDGLAPFDISPHGEYVEELSSWKLPEDKPQVHNWDYRPNRSYLTLPLGLGKLEIPCLARSFGFC